MIWYPFTQMKTASAPINIVRGEGVYIYDEKGNAYLDAVSSWWVSIHGHSHPYIAEKVSAQLKTLEHVILAGFCHPPILELTERLLKHLPHHYSIFYSDDGSTAVEVGLKMAIQYWDNQDKPKSTFVAFKEAYHGDTFGAMAVGDRGPFTKPFWPFMFDVHFIDPPFEGKIEQSVQQLKDVISVNEKDDSDGNDNNIIGFIFEPLVQGAGGMLMHSAEGLDELLSLCRQHDIITIADEVMTGFWRTGRFFATDHLQNNPDIVCMSKGLTGGTMAMGATACNQRLFEGFLSEDKAKTFFHGHSYTGNPLACSAALASLDLLESDEYRENLKRIELQHAAFKDKIQSHPKVSSVRHRGVIIAIDFRTPGETSYFNTIRDNLYHHFLNKNILLRPLGNTIYILPPYCINNDQLNQLYEAISFALDHLEEIAITKES